MKIFIKKYWLLFLIATIINLPILILCCVRTDKTITLKGDTTIIEKFVEVALLNWITVNYSDMNLEKVSANKKAIMREITNNIKIQSELERVSGEESVVVTKANEIFEIKCINK